VNLTDEQWEIVEPLIPDPPRRADGKGRPGGTPGTCSTASRGSRVPGPLARPAGALSAPPETCQRSFLRRNEEGVLDEALRGRAEGPKERGGLYLSECFVDGTFVGTKKGEARWERP
jgi:hypothetical protein